ncbi:MAG: transcription elongation factor GreA [Fibrobacteraceae bacterium]|nr:transcription elongation factor GreA [Fibrobacteraceae bacterium]
MKHLISKEGFEKLKAEWEKLKYDERPKMINQVQAAAAEGDRSENAAYTYGRMRVREIDRRLRELDRILDGAQVVSTAAPDDGSIRFGATIKLLDKKTHREKIYRIVGEKEIDPLQGNISMKSPIGESLMGKKEGDEVKVVAPRGTILYQITKVTYEG